jgi:hypothetical protein
MTRSEYEDAGTISTECTTQETQGVMGEEDRVDRVLGFFCRQNWDPPHMQASGSPSFGSGEGDSLACRREGGGSQFGRGNRHCGTLGARNFCTQDQKQQNKPFRTDRCIVPVMCMQGRIQVCA